MFFLPSSGTEADKITIEVRSIVPNVAANSSTELRCMLRFTCSLIYLPVDIIVI